jgi:hypothetical protein
MLPSTQLSALYSSLSCHHHLIPKSANPYETPHLAALTPHGFASFMTILIQAYPDIEFHRLSATVRDWPVSNADERKERWPKELSRRLLPRSGSETERRLLLDALRKVGVTLPASCYPPPPTQAGYGPNSGPYNYSSSAPSGFVPPPPASAPPAHNLGSQSRSHRSNYPGPSGSNRDLQDNNPEQSSDESSAPSVTLERERKPYVAKEGTGKVYEEPLERVKSASGAIPATQAPPPFSARHHSTSNQPSIAPMPQYIPPSTSTTAGSGRTRERGASISQTGKPDSYAGRDPHPGYQRSSRARSPSYGQPGYGRSSGERVEGGSNGSSAYYEDERYYDRDRLDRVTSRDEDERERERRYAKYDEEYRRGAGMSNTYAGGNPPLGTGERRY